MTVLAAGCGDDDGSPPDAAMADGGPSDGGPPAPVDAQPDPFDASFMRAGDPPAHSQDDTLRLNHIQMEGTHNSYHREPDPVIPDWDYDNEPLDEQLESQGVRAFELDTYWDERRLRWEVLHIPTIDEETTCDLLLDCLSTIRAWSDAHPGHHPIFVQIEPKGNAFPEGAEGDWRFDQLDAEIRMVFDDELLVLPDEVQGRAATLREAVTTTGWPTLGEVRGKTLFFFNCSRDHCVRYANEGAGLAGRVIFADARADDPWAAFRIINGGGSSAREAVEAGFIVRSRAVSMPNALEQSEGELQSELDSVLATGAHIISTDVPEPRDDVALHVAMPGGSPSRCNPVSAPAECTAAAVEDPALLVP
ncbi:MAG: hypothetical protein JJ863_29210 [Deltaproteobacteria bacterium]|nr:hypothetical protein [Deltaproteobacteria bacterium]